MTAHPHRRIFGRLLKLLVFAAGVGGASHAAPDGAGLPFAVLDALALVADAGPEAGAEALETLLREIPSTDLRARGAVLWGLSEARLQQGQYEAAKELAAASLLAWQRAGDAEGTQPAAQEDQVGPETGDDRLPPPVARGVYMVILAQMEAGTGRLDDALRHVETALQEMQALAPHVPAARRVMAALYMGRVSVLLRYQETESVVDDLAMAMAILRDPRTVEGGTAEDLMSMKALAEQIEMVLPLFGGEVEAALDRLTEGRRKYPDLFPPELARTLDFATRIESEGVEAILAHCRALAENPDHPTVTTESTFLAPEREVCVLVQQTAAAAKRGQVELESVQGLLAILVGVMDEAPAYYQESTSRFILNLFGLLEAPQGPEKWPSTAELQAAVRGGEAAYASVPPRLRASADSSLALFLELAVRVRARAGDAAGAFELGERGRARTFQDRLPGIALGSDGRLPVDPEGAREILLLRSRRNDLEHRIRESSWSGGSTDEIEPLLQEIRAVRRELDATFRRLALQQPESRRLEPLSVEEVQASLGEDTTLVAYLTFSPGAGALAWVVDRDEVHLVPLDVSTPEIEHDVRLYGRILREGLPVGDLPERLYSALWTPLGHLVETERVLVVPHGPLQELPFAALRDPHTGRWLMERATLSYAPSASVWTWLRSRPGAGAGAAVVLADPQGDLPAARAEARAVAALWGVSPRVGEEASETALRSAGSTASLVHLSVHGVLSPHDPFFTYLDLAGSPGDEEDPRRDGRLELHEVEDDLDLAGVSLVVLPACHGAEGPRTAGDEVTSLARAFLLAGARSTVTTAWAVDDDDAAKLMVDFHRHLAAGVEAAEALRLAQLAALASAHHGHPSHWAAFALHGAGGPLPRPPS